jgi:hypothetical protein
MRTHQPLADVEFESGAGYAGSVHGFSPLSPRTFKVIHWVLGFEYNSLAIMLRI